jgi:hypothetical protein
MSSFCSATSRATGVPKHGRTERRILCSCLSASPGGVQRSELPAMATMWPAVRRESITTAGTRQSVWDCHDQADSWIGPWTVDGVYLPSARAFADIPRPMYRITRPSRTWPHARSQVVARHRGLMYRITGHYPVAPWRAGRLPGISLARNTGHHCAGGGGRGCGVHYAVYGCRSRRVGLLVPRAGAADPVGARPRRHQTPATWRQPPVVLPGWPPPGNLVGFLRPTLSRSDAHL